MLGRILQADLEELIQARDFNSLSIALVELPAADVAEILIDLPDDDEAVVFRLLPRELAAEAFSHLPPADQETLLRHLHSDTLVNILNDMTPDDRVRLLAELPGGVTARLLTVLKPEELKVTRELLGYPDGTIGRLMTPEYVAIRAELTVAEVLAHLRKVASDKETLNVLYVVDERGKLLDDIRLAQVVLAEPDKKVSQLMDFSVTSLSAFEPRAEAVLVFRKYGRVALPVVDSGGILLGIVTVDDVLDVAHREADEDMQRFGGHDALDDPYFATGHWTMVRKRAVWLLVLLAGGMLTTSALESFQDSMMAVPALTLFFQMVIGSGGNSGTQSASLILRGLAVREIESRDWLRVLGREMLSGLTLGVILSVFAFARVHLSDSSIHASSVAMTVAISLAASVTIGAITGAMLPMLFARLGADPAVTSSPFISTLVDVTGVVIYFLIAQVVLGAALAGG